MSMKQKQLRMKCGKIEIEPRKKNMWFYHKGEKVLTLSKKDTMSLATVLFEFVGLITKDMDGKNAKV